MASVGSSSHLSSPQPGLSNTQAVEKQSGDTAQPDQGSRTPPALKRGGPSPIHNAKRARWADKSPQRNDAVSADPQLRQSLLDKPKDETNVEPALREEFKGLASQELQEAGRAQPQLRQALLDKLKDGTNVEPALREAFERQALQELLETANAHLHHLRQSSE